MKTYNHIAVVSIIINYAVGTGILNLPHTFASASIGVSVIMVFIVTFSTFLLGQYTVDVLARTFALERSGKIRLKQQYTEDGSNNTEDQDLLKEDQDSVRSCEHTDYTILNQRTYQFATLCQVYLGKAGFILY